MQKDKVSGEYFHNFRGCEIAIISLLPYLVNVTTFLGAALDKFIKRLMVNQKVFCEPGNGCGLIMKMSLCIL